MAARNRLELCSSREFELQQARDDFLEVSLICPNLALHLFLRLPL